MIEFTVYGVASTMGSKRAFIPKGWTHPVITDSNRNLRSWQSLVADAASRAITERRDWQILDGPVRLTLLFFLPRPKSLPKKVLAHTKAPDTSKLVRSTEDAMSGIVYRDDSQVIELIAAKCYASAHDSPHVYVRVEPTTEWQPVTGARAPLPLFGDAITQTTGERR